MKPATCSNSGPLQAGLMKWKDMPQAGRQSENFHVAGTVMVQTVGIAGLETAESGLYVADTEQKIDFESSILAERPLSEEIEP